MESQARLEQLRVQFIVAEIDTAWALARSARIVYASNSEHAPNLADKAWEAYEQALIDFKEIRGKELRDSLGGKLNQIRAVLNALPARKAHRRNGKV